jgi:hypothetical protein
METLLRDGSTTAAGRTIIVGPPDSGRMVALRVGDRLAIDAPSFPGASWRIRGGMPVLVPATPQLGEPAFVLSAAQPGRIGVDLVASGAAQTLPRPIRLIACVSSGARGTRGG